MLEKAVFISNLAATLFMTGVIWLVQIVHYPLFEYVGGERYRAFHVAHMNLISYVVAPMMIVEIGTAVLLIFYPLPNSDWRLLWAGVALAAIIWASTFFLQVPLHEKLANGYDADTHRALVSTNWLRTTAWTLRAALMLWLLWINFGRSNS